MPPSQHGCRFNWMYSLAFYFVKSWWLYLRFIRIFIIHILLSSNKWKHIMHNILTPTVSGAQVLIRSNMYPQGSGDLPTSSSSQQLTSVRTDTSTTVQLAAEEETTSHLPRETQYRTTSTECSNKNGLADMPPSTVGLSIFHCIIYMPNNYTYCAIHLLVALVII